MHQGHKWVVIWYSHSYVDFPQCTCTQLLYAHDINLSLKTWPGVKSGTSKWSKAAGAAQRQEPSACLPATLPRSWAGPEAWVSCQWNLCSLLGLNPEATLTDASSARKQTAFDFTDVPGNPRLSVKGVWMRVKIWSGRNPGLVKQEERICR